MRFPFQKHASYNDHTHRSNYGPGVVVIPSYVQIAGQAAVDFAKSRTVDLVVRDDANAPASWRREVSGFLERTIRDQFGKTANIHWAPTGTADGLGIPAFDLVLRQSDGAATLQKAASYTAPDNGENHHGVMVAFHVHPDVSRQIRVRGGVKPKDHHITLAYLGSKENFTPAGIDRLHKTVAAFAKSAAPLYGSISGASTFNTKQDDGSYPFVALVNAPGHHHFASDFHRYLMRNGFMPSQDYGFTPHISLAFPKHGQQIQDMNPFPNAPAVSAAPMGKSAFRKDADYTAHDDSVSGMGAQFDGLPGNTALPDMPKVPLVMDTLHVHVGGQVTSYPMRGKRDSDSADVTSPSGPSQEPGFNLGNPIGDTFASIGDGYAEPVTTAVDSGQFDCDQRFIKAAPEKQYTFSVVYKASSPGAVHLDAHKEFTTADELQDAQWDYVKRGNRSIFVQHGLAPFGFQKAGEWTDIVQWPYLVQAVLKTVDGQTHDAEIPAGSVYMGVKWEPWAWDYVKQGKIRGFSFGGKANRTVVRLDNG